MMEGNILAGNLLNGVCVIDLSELAPGPFCTMFLADMGARVIKVERPEGDPARKMFPGVYESLNRNKKSIVLDLKKEEGKKILFKLIKKANVFVENYRPGVVHRLGFGYEKMKSLNKRIVYCSISSYGQDGPYSNLAGHDINCCSVAGISSISGQPGGPPEIGSGIPIADYSSSLFACISILSMLFAKKGGVLDVSMTDCALSLMPIRINEYLARGKPEKKKLMGRGGYGIFRTKDGKFVAIAPVEQHFWERFCQVIGREDLSKNSRFNSWVKRNEHMDEINPILDKVFTARSRDDWVSFLSKSDIPCSPVNFIDEIAYDPQVISRRMIVEIDKNENKIINILFPVLFNGQRMPLHSPAPSHPGEHTEQILLELGLTVVEIETLKAKGVTS